MSVAARRYYLRGKSALDAGDIDGALEGLSAAVELSPGFVAARLAYAAALAQRGDCPRAAQTLRSGLTRRGVTATERGAMLASLGDVLVRGGDFPGAEEAYGQLGDPRFEARAASGRARVAAKTGRYADAFAALSRAAKLAAGS